MMAEIAFWYGAVFGFGVAVFIGIALYLMDDPY